LFSPCISIGSIITFLAVFYASIEDEIFKDEIITTPDFSIAKREDGGETNAYYCPTCGSWIANNRLLGRNTYVYKDEKILTC